MTERKRRVGTWAALAGLVGALAVVAAGCGGDDGGGSTSIEGLGSSLEEIQENAREEGAVNIVQWPGYAQLTKEFTAATGCTVNTKDGGSSDDMISLIQTGEYDGVSASGNASVRLMATGEVAPIDPELVPNYADVQEGIKNQDYNSLDGEPYGVPHGRGPNYLMFRTDDVPEGTDTWGVIWEDDQLASTRARSRSTTTRSSSRTLRSTSRRRSPTWGSTTRTCSTTSSSPRRSTCSRSRRRTSASTGRATLRSRSSRTPTATAWSGRPGRTSTSS